MIESPGTGFRVGDRLLAFAVEGFGLPVRISRRLFVLVVLASFFAWQPQARSSELVMFEAADCPWCARWDAEVGVVYAKTDEGRELPLRRVDLHASRPADLVGIKRITFTPTFVLVDKGREIGRITGYPGEDHFWGLLEILRRRWKAAGVRK